MSSGKPATPFKFAPPSHPIRAPAPIPNEAKFNPFANLPVNSAPAPTFTFSGASRNTTASSRSATTSREASPVTTAATTPTKGESDSGISDGAARVPRVRVKVVSMEETKVKNNDGHAAGLANPKMSQASRRMLDLVNGLHSTGCVTFYSKAAGVWLAFQVFNVQQLTNKHFDFGFIAFRLTLIFPKSQLLETKALGNPRLSNLSLELHFLGLQEPVRGTPLILLCVLSL